MIGVYRGRRVKYKEWTEYSSDTETVFVQIEGGKIHKIAEWRLISDTKMEYISYNLDGSIARHSIHTGSDILDCWREYHQKYV